MAAEANKNPVSSQGEKQPATKVKVGNVRQPSARSRFSRNNVSLKKLALFLVFILVLLIGAAIITGKVHIGQKVYAQAAGHKIYKQDIEKLVGTNEGISDHAAATVLADKYLTQAMGKEHHVTVTEADMEAAYGSDIKSQKTNNPYAYQNLLNQLYFTKLNANNQGSYRGKLLVANFSRNVPYQSPLLAEDKAADPNIGNPAAIAADKKYAQDFITNLYDQIKAKKITFDQAIQMEHDDPVVGLEGYPTQSHSAAFNGPLSQNSLLGATSVRSKVESIKPGELTEPFVVRSSSSMYDDGTAESYFLVVQLDSKSGGGSNMGFTQELAQAKKQFGYKVYV